MIYQNSGRKPPLLSENVGVGSSKWLISRISFNILEYI